MNRVFEILNTEMPVPHSYGWYHFLWLGIIAFCIILMIVKRKPYSDKQLKGVLLFYGITSLVLEVLKQLIWSYNLETGVWTYQWYAAPFQLCTTPIFASLIAAFTKNKKVKKSMLAYMAFISILGSLATVIYPETCFCSNIEVNIHTMFLHCMSFVLSIYIILHELKGTLKELKDAGVVFIIFEMIALTLDIVFYKTNIIHGETFNMFFISPYFECTLPILSIIYKKVPYILFLIIYNIFLIGGGALVYLVVKLFKKKKKHS